MDNETKNCQLQTCSGPPQEMEPSTHVPEFSATLRGERETLFKARVSRAPLTGPHSLAESGGR